MRAVLPSPFRGSSKLLSTVFMGRYGPHPPLARLDHVVRRLDDRATEDQLSEDRHPVQDLGE